VSIYEPISMVIRDSCSDESLPPPLSLSLPMRRGIFMSRVPAGELSEREREKRENGEEASAGASASGMRWRAIIN